MHGNTDALRVRGRRTLLGGRIIFNNNSSIFDCVIREMSEKGAVLELGSTFALPPVFVLETKPFKQRHACSVYWRTANTVDVVFLDAEPNPMA